MPNRKSADGVDARVRFDEKVAENAARRGKIPSDVVSLVEPWSKKKRTCFEDLWAVYADEFDRVTHARHAVPQPKHSNVPSRFVTDVLERLRSPTQRVTALSRAFSPPDLPWIPMLKNASEALVALEDWLREYQPRRTGRPNAGATGVAAEMADELSRSLHMTKAKAREMACKCSVGVGVDLTTEAIRAHEKRQRRDRQQVGSETAEGSAQDKTS